MDDYIIICPNGLESYTSEAIQSCIPTKYTCLIHILTPRLGDLQIEDLKARLRDRITKKRIRKGNTCNMLSKDQELLFGTIEVGDNKLVNLGFNTVHESIISFPGGLEGKSLMRIQTDAPSSLIADVRTNGCGALLATILVESEISYSLCELSDASTTFSNIIGRMGKTVYQMRLSAALDLWAKHAKPWHLDTENTLCVVSKGTRPKLDSNEKMSNYFDRIIKGIDPYKYRLSCIRYGKDWSYKREDLITYLADLLIPCNTLIDGVSSRYKVDLTNYDFDLVVIIQKDLIVLGISLNPFQHIGAKGFDRNDIPPDVTMPYINKDFSKSIIRLRPSIASLLYHISGVLQGDIVVDPCAGVNTIPNEGAFRNCYAIGGDIALCCENGIEKVASAYAHDVRRYQAVKKLSGASDMTSWNASLIPIRDGCVDHVISDLPFGVRCMSAAKLKAFLPLLFSECARILRHRASMTLLCGAVNGILEGLADANRETTIFDSPSAIFPVNIGGLQAWVIQVRRSLNTAQGAPNHRARVVRMTKSHNQRIKGSSKNVQS